MNMNIKCYSIAAAFTLAISLCDNPLWAQNKINMETFKRLSPNMDRKTVESIIGPPGYFSKGYVFSTAANPDFLVQPVVWTDDLGEIRVLFDENGRLTSANFYSVYRLPQLEMIARGQAETIVKPSPISALSAFPKLPFNLENSLRKKIGDIASGKLAGGKGVRTLFQH